MDTKTFHIGDILTIVTGTFCSPNGVGAIYEILGWMTDDAIATHQLPRVSEECEPELRRQHPDLAEVVVPPLADQFEGMAWLSTQVLKFGEYREVGKLPAVDHTSIAPLDEIRMMRPDLPIVPLDLRDGD